MLKDLLHEQVARIGQAVASPKRLELLELLAQGEKSVETLSANLSANIKLTSAHLKALKEARLVASRRDGKYMIYRLSGTDVGNLWVNLREVAQAHLPFARSMPVSEIERRILELPRNKEIVAYCRGPFCLLSDEAVALLQARGYRVRKTLDGVVEWQAAGLPVEGQGASH